MSDRKPLDGAVVNVRVKIAAAWASVMFCYIYADYFGLYAPGKLQSMLDGRIAPLGPVTEGVLVFVSAMLAVPALMIFLTVALPSAGSRWLNVAFGLLYSGIILLTMWDYAFMIFFGGIEISLTLLIAWYAVRWPRGLG